MLRNEKPQCVIELYALVNIIQIKQGHHMLNYYTSSYAPNFFPNCPAYISVCVPHILFSIVQIQPIALHICQQSQVTPVQDTLFYLLFVKSDPKIYVLKLSNQLSSLANVFLVPSLSHACLYLS